jgi:co-chaperonin GroES (HSP10)
MRMLNNNVLVRKLKNQPIGNIVMPDGVSEEWNRGEVLGVGPDVNGINVGDTVVYLAPPPHVGEFPKVDTDGSIVITSSYICGVED